MDETYTWGISGPSFLWLYAGLCAVTAVAIWLLRRRLLNAGSGGPAPAALDVYELAMLNGGPALAITTAAAKLHSDGALGSGADAKTIVAASRRAGATDLEHEVYSAVERTNGISGRVLRRQLEDCATLREMASRLTDAGLLLEDGRRALVDSLWLLAVPLVLLGVARAIAGVHNDRPVLYIVIMTFAVVWATARFAFKRARATARGQQRLDSERGGRTSVAHTPVGAEIPLAVALFGSGVLWAADPAIASAWAVPREHAWAGGSGSSGGGSSCGGGGCGGGGCGG
ncbi:MAG: hypothetical protein QOJ89_2926 [bacterium]|jgi:uncharacterized protein (TIGR04222 family)